MALKAILLTLLSTGLYFDSSHSISDVVTHTVQLFASSTSLDRFPQNVSLNQTSLSNSTPVQESCYPWMFRNETSGACECSNIPSRTVYCDGTIPRTSILECYCMTYNHKLNKTELGFCLFGCGHSGITYYKLPQNLSELNAITCAKANRDSTLCGKCKAGYSPLVYSYDMSCMNCTGLTYNWIKYIAVAYIPLTFFLLFVMIFRVDGTSPLLRGLITICQGLVSPTCMRFYLRVARERPDLNVAFKVLSTLYGVWNLDFFRTVFPPLCLEISILQALVLDYAVAFYPMVVVLVTYILIRLYSCDVRIIVWLWKPFHKIFRFKNQDWDVERSVIKSFATFFLLSYLKILNVTVDILVYTNKYTLSLGERTYQVEYVPYYDASVEYFRGQHLYFGISAIFIGVFFVILPLVFLVIYSTRCFQKCLNFFRIHRQCTDMFVNCYQGHYKDGTNGTRDCRCFSVVFFIIQIIVMVFFTVTKTRYCFLVASMMFVIVMFLQFTVQPYKEQFKVYNIIDSFMFLILALICISIIARDEADIRNPSLSTPTYIFMGVVEIVPALYLIGLIVWWLFVRKKLHRKFSCFRVQDTEQSRDSDYLPHRVENPRIYEDQASPLLGMSQENSISSDSASLT